MALFSAYTPGYPQVSGAAGATFGPFGTSGVPQTGLPAGYSLLPGATPVARSPYPGGLPASAAATFSAPVAVAFPATEPMAWNTLAAVWACPYPVPPMGNLPASPAYR